MSLFGSGEVATATQIGTKPPSKTAEFQNVRFLAGKEGSLTYIFFAINFLFIRSQNACQYHRGKLLETLQDSEREGNKMYVQQSLLLYGFAFQSCGYP